MSVITIEKAAIAHNIQHNCWATPSRRKPIRIMRDQNDAAPAMANVADIFDAQGNIVASVVSSRDGKPIANFGTHVVVFTVHPAKVKA